MIDRIARNRVIEALDSYMENQITAFDFDKALSDASWQTKDDTVVILREVLWAYYDDLIDHKIVASKAQWQFFNRARLMLQSNEELQYNQNKQNDQWCWSSVISACVIAGLMSAIFYYGIGIGLATLVIGVLVIGFLSPVESGEPLGNLFDEMDEQALQVLFPFKSVGELACVRRSMVKFTKKPYPSYLENRKRWNVTLKRLSS